MDANDARTLAPPRTGARGGAAAPVATDPSVVPPERTGNAALWRGVDQAHIMSLELIVAVFLWGGIGWWVDGRLGTGAWFTVIGAMIGNAAGVYLVWLRAQRLDGLDVASQAAAAQTAQIAQNAQIAQAAPAAGVAGMRGRPARVR